MNIIVDKQTGAVLYASLIDLDLPETQDAIPSPNDYEITPNSVYNFETQTFYEKSE
jgi:hypothetical protein